jgi:hypothetical protein
MAEVESLTTVARIDANVVALNELMHQLLKDIRRWIRVDPPDQSPNFCAASDAHCEGTAAWCIEGKTFADWMAYGSLLWIHGKRKYTIAAVLIVANDSWADSWLREDYSQVRYSPRRVA